MKKQMKFIGTFLIAVTASLLLTNCSDDDSGSTANLSVRLTDAPGDFDAVYIDVQDVLIKESLDDDDANGWVSIGAINSGVYDLLELTGGTTVLLADNEVPAEDVGQIRLLLGDNNTIVIDGQTFPLKTPSGQQSGLKVKVNETLEPGFSYDFLIDFDVDKSIVFAGNSDNINLKPVLRATTVATTGIIKGSVNVTDYQVLASVTVGEEEVTAYADDEGKFVLYGVPAGTYDLTLTPEEASGFLAIVVEDVAVVNGEVTDVGSVTFE